MTREQTKWELEAYLINQFRSQDFDGTQPLTGWQIKCRRWLALVRADGKREKSVQREKVKAVCEVLNTICELTADQINWLRSDAPALGIDICHNGKRFVPGTTRKERGNDHLRLQVA